MTLWVLGICLLGFASGATYARWNYQAQQERALFAGGPAVSVHTTEPEIPVAPERTANAEVDHPTKAPAQEVDRADLARPDQASSVEHVAASAPPVIKKSRAAAVDSTVVGRVEIPRLGVAAMIKDGADEGTLARAVGRVPGTARPGEVGNTVLAGHRDTFFRPLRRIKVDDRIRVIVPPHTYEYRVESLRVVGPHDTSVLQSNGAETLTLVTCYPFRYVGPAPDRFIVSAERVN